MSAQSHDWKVPPVAYTYDGRLLAEFEDPMELAAERVRVRFGGQVPRDVSLALNDAYRRGRKAGREEALRDIASAIASLRLDGNQ